MSIEPFLRMDLSYAANLAEMKRLFEKVLMMVRDSAVTVQKAARDTVIILTGLIPNFEALLSRLTPTQQTLYEDEVAGKNVRTSHEMKLLRSSLRNLSEEPPHSVLLEPLERPTGGYAFQSSSISSIAQTLAATKAPQVMAQSNTAPNGLEFGFVPSDIMTQLRDASNWHSRASAIQELEGLINTTEDFDPLMPYMAAFFRLLKELLTDTNFKVMQSTLSIIGALVAIPNISKRANIAQLIPSCREKLGDNKIAIRQAAFRVFKAFIRETPPRVLFPHLEEGLESENWHIREEVVQLIITAMLSKLPNYDYDFMQLLPVICRLLKDTKPKVKFAAIETVAVLAYLRGADFVLEEAQNLVEEDTLEVLRNRLQQTHLPVLQEDFVEFPKMMPASAPVLVPTTFATAYPSEGREEMRESPVKAPPVEHRLADLSSNDSTEDTSISPQPNMLKFGGVRRMAASSLDFHPRRPNHRGPRRFFAFRQGSMGQTRDLPQPASLRPPYIPINMTTKAGGSSKKVSYGYQVRSNSLMRRNMPRYKTLQSLEDGQNQSQVSTDSIERSPAQRKSSDPLKSDMYLKPEELPPADNPEEEFQQCLNNSKSQEWSVQFETLNMIRRLLRHHPGVFLSQTSLHTVILGVAKMADSLRSSLSKNSLIVISEMSNALKRALDMDLEVLSSLLLRKCADTNVFISEEADKALASICSNCTGSRVAATLLSQSVFAKSSPMKAKIASGFKVVTAMQIFDKSLGFVHKIKDMDRIILTLSGYTSDASQEVRASAKAAFLALRGAFGADGDFERLVTRTLPDSAALKLREMMEQEPSQEIASSPRRPPLSTRKPPKSFVEPQEPDFADIPQLAADMTHSEWKRRYDAVDRTLSLITTHSDSLKRSSKLVTVIDLLNKALADANLSVTLHALSGMTKVMPLLSGTLEPHSTLIMHALVVAVGSANSAIRDAARHTLYALFRHSDFAYTVPALMTVIPASAPKAKPTLLALLCGDSHSDYLPEVHAKKPSLVHKHVLPLTFKMLDDPKQEIRSECYKLVHALYAVIGSVLVECTPASKLQKVMDLLNE